MTDRIPAHAVDASGVPDGQAPVVRDGELTFEPAGTSTASDVLALHRFLIGAHRGDINATDGYPEGSLEAARQAARKGADLVEIDAVQSADGTFWSSHDVTVDRVTGGTGAFNAKTDAQLAALTYDAGYGYDAGRHGSAISLATVEQLLDAIEPYGAVAAIQCNEGDVTALAELVVSAGWTARTIVEVSTTADAAAVKAVSPSLSVMMRYDLTGATSSEDVEWLSQDVDAMTTLAATEAFAPKAVKAYLSIGDYGTDETARFESAYTLGARCYQTSNLDAVLAMRDGGGGTAVSTMPAFTEPADSTMKTLAVSILNQANKYTLNTWLPTAFPGTGPISIASNTEAGVRPAASAADGLAAALVTGTHDPAVTGVSEADARVACARLVGGLAADHVANGGIWGGTSEHPPDDGSVSEADWISANWAARTVLAAWLTQEDLTETDLTNVANLAAHEANRMLGWDFPYYRDTSGTILFPGDTKAEEIAWDATILQFACMMMPGHPSASAWWAKLLEMGIAAYSSAADLTSTERLNGLVVGDTLNGSNINADGTVTNQDKVTPDYMVTGAEGLWVNGALLNATGRVIPAATLHNADVIYAALDAQMYVDGSWEILYPDGVSWGTHRIIHVALMDVLAHLHGWDAGLDTTAEEWALLHLQRQADLQARDTTGQTFQDTAEDSYAGREQWVAHLAAMIVIALYSGPPVVSNAHGDVARQQTIVQYPAPAPDPAPAVTTALVPWTTTTTAGEFTLMWDDNGNLMMTEVPL